MRIGLGDPVSAWVYAPADPPPNMGARVEVPYTRAIATAWAPATLEDTGTTLRWVVELASPVTAGDYLLVWRDGGPEPPVTEIFIPLMVG